MADQSPHIHVTGAGVDVHLAADGAPSGPPTILVPGLAAGPADFVMHPRRTLAGLVHDSGILLLGLHLAGNCPLCESPLAGPVEPDLEPTIHLIDNGDGRALELTRYAGKVDPSQRQVVTIPGYAMNTFILAYHPSSRLMVEYLVDDGFEVCTADRRGQGGSTRHRGAARRYGLREQSLVDLPVALDAARGRTRHPVVDVVGCSLGATMVYAFLAHHLDDHDVGAVIAVLVRARRHVHQPPSRADGV